MHRGLRFALVALAGFAPVCLSGCRSAMVDASLHNDSGTTLRLIEVDYPSASFGVQSLAGGATFHYRFKILGNGALKLTLVSTTGKEETFTGPDLHEGQEGTLRIELGPGHVAWQPTLHDR